MESLLTTPDQFFRDKRSSKSLPKATVLVLAVGVVSLIGPAYVFGKIVKTFPGESQSLLTLGGMITLTSAFLGVFLTWVAYAGVLHLLSGYFTSDGDFRSVFAAVGWSFLPILVYSLLLSIVTISTFWNVTFPTDPTEIVGYLNGVRSRSILPHLQSLGGLFTLWQGFLLIFALKHSRQLEIRQACIVVTPTVVGSLLLAFLNIG